MAVLRKPRLIFEATIRRRPYMRRGLWSLLAAVAALAAVLALNYSAGRVNLDGTLLTVGTAVGLVVLIWFGLRAVVNLWRGLRRRDEDLRFFDKGFVWKRRQEQHKYGWSQLATYREGGGGLYMGQRALMQWGGHTLTMLDGRVFHVTGAYGDLRAFAQATRRYAARVTGTRMAQRLREEEPVKLHPRLTVWPGGIEVGKEEIPWSEIDVRRRDGRLVILRKAESGKFRQVRQYPVNQVDNVGGLLDVATSTIRNHQRERFEKRPVVN